MAEGLGGRVIEDAIVPAQTVEAPKYHIEFAVCGMSHDHIYGMVGAIQRGSGEQVAAWDGEEDKLAAFAKRFPDVKTVKAQDEILDDPSVQLALSSQIANERAPLGVRVMKHGKDGSGANREIECGTLVIWLKWTEGEQGEKHRGYVSRVTFRPRCHRPVYAVVLMLQAPLS